MDIGKLRHRVELQSVIRTKAQGGYEESWVTYAKAWASVEPLKGNELVSAQQVDARVTHRIEIRYREGVTSEHRVLHLGRALNPVQVLDVEERHVTLRMIAFEDV